MEGDEAAGEAEEGVAYVEGGGERGDYGFGERRMDCGEIL